MSYVYKCSEPGLWTVGCNDPQGGWYPESDHNSEEKAAARVRYLNGGSNDETSAARTPALLTKREYFAALAMQGLLADNANDGENWTSIARDAVHAADALLAELAKERT